MKKKKESFMKKKVHQRICINIQIIICLFILEIDWYRQSDFCELLWNENIVINIFIIEK